MRGRRWRHLRLVLVLLPQVACSGQTGCLGCGGSYDYPSPPPAAGEIQNNTLLGHVQQSGVLFVARHLADVLRARLPTRTVGGIERATFYLPETTYRSTLADVTLRDGCIGPTPIEQCPNLNPDDGDTTRGPTYRSMIELNLDTIDDTIDATFIPGSGSTPDGVRISLYNVDVFMDLAILAQGLAVPGDAACHIQDKYNDRAAFHLERLRFTVTLAVDAQSRFQGDVVDVEVLIDRDSFINSDMLSLDVSPCNGGVCNDPTCHDSWLNWDCSVNCAVGGFVFGAADFLAGVLEPLIEWIAPSVVELAMGMALDQVNGQPLMMSGRYGFDEIFGANGRLAPLLMDPTAISFGAWPNDDAFVVSGPIDARGMRLALDAGTFADPSQCAPMVVLPRFAAQLGPPPFFDGTLQVNGHTEAYDFAVSVSEAFAAQAAFSAYTLGGMCLFLSTDELARLSNGAVSLATLALLVPSLVDWASPHAPVMFIVHPTAAPKVRFGTGATTGHDPDGAPIIDSLLQIDFGEMGVSIYTLVDDELTRLATVAADVKLGAPLNRTPQNTIEIGIDKLEVANVVEVYDELLPASDWGSLLEVLLNVAIGAMIDGMGSFNLDLAPIVSRMLGGAPVYARINAVERAGADVDKGFVVAYLTLCDAADLTNPAKPPCYTAPIPTALGAVRLVGAARGAVRFAVERTREYQVRVDGGAWTGFRGAVDGEVRFGSPLLRLPGDHQVELRGRSVGRYQTLGPATAFAVPVD